MLYTEVFQINHILNIYIFTVDISMTKPKI